MFSVIGIVIMGTLLSALGYVASSDDLHSQQSDSAIAALYITFSILPALTAFLGIAILSSYQLSAEQLGDNATAIARQESERESRGSSSRLR